MKTFIEYVGERDRLQKIIQEIVEEAEKNEILREVLIQEGWWDQAKAIGQGAWNFLKGTGRDIGQQAKGAWSAVTGPATQLTHALSALQSARQQIAKTPEIANSTTTGDAQAGFPAMPLTNWLDGVIRQLQSQSSQIKNMTVTGAQAGYNAKATPAPGVQMGMGTQQQQQFGPAPVPTTS